MKGIQDQVINTFSEIDNIDTPIIKTRLDEIAIQEYGCYYVELGIEHTFQQARCRYLYRKKYEY